MPLKQSGGEDAATHADDDDAGAMEHSGGEDAANRAEEEALEKSGSDADDDDPGDLEQSGGGDAAIRAAAAALEKSGGESTANHAAADDNGVLQQSAGEDNANRGAADAVERSGGEGTDALEQSAGADVANGADDNSAGAGGEDRLSTLPDDVLVLILRRLNSTSDAATTSILSRRWHHVWTLLPELYFIDSNIDPHSLGRVLSASEVPLSALSVVRGDASHNFPAAWLPNAALRVSGILTLYNFSRSRSVVSPRDTFELACFEKATSIDLYGYLGLSLPRTGLFARLTKLNLQYVWIYGSGEFGDAVSFPRCPCLQKLVIAKVKGLDRITINSKSIQVLTLDTVYGVRQITVVASSLRKFILSSCFISEENQPIVNMSVPQLESLKWWDSYDQSSVDLGSMRHLVTLDTSFPVYGTEDFITENCACLMLLPRFEAIGNLALSLTYPKEIDDDSQYLIEDMTKLPDVISLHLTFEANGHSFGASLFHVLKICSNIKQLRLVLSGLVELPSACPLGCICGEQTNWQTEEISLNHLQELEIERFRGLEHDIGFVKRLLSWVPVLKMLTVTFNHSITENKVKELAKMIRSFCRPDVCIKFYVLKNFYKKLPAAED